MHIIYLDIPKILKFLFTIFLCFSLISFPISVFNTDKVYAANVLTNPSFTTDASDWTLQITGQATTTIGRDGTTSQDSGGSLIAGQARRNGSATATAIQTISTTLEAGSSVNLSFYWKKQCVALQCSTNTISVEIAPQGGSYSTLWTDTSRPNANVTTAWTQASGINVSSYITETNTYNLRLSFSFAQGNNASAASYAWFDNLNLDVTPPNITVSTAGTQTANIHQGTQNAYVGGAFTFLRSGGSTSVTSIAISNTGTISNSHISGLILHYKQESTCSTSIPGDATQFNSTPGTFSSGTSTVTGSMSVGTSQVCLYVELDVSPDANIGDTIEIQITNPSTQVIPTLGTVSPSSPVVISGTTTIDAAAIISISIETDGDIDYGILPATESRSTIDLSDTQTIKNTGNVNIDLQIKSTNAFGGVPWELSSTYGNDTFVHEYSTDSGSLWNKFFISDQYFSLISGLTPTSTQNVDFRITVPSLTTDYLEKNITITILATEST